MDPVVSAQAAVPPSPQVVQPVSPAFVPVASPAQSPVPPTSAPSLQVETPTPVTPTFLQNSTPLPAQTVAPAPVQPVAQAAPQVSDPMTVPTAVTSPQTIASETEALAQPLAQSVATAPTAQPISVPGKSKEAGSSSQEVANFVEVVGNDSLENEPLPPEVSSWMEKVNRDSGQDTLPEVVVADTTAQNPTGNYSSDPVFVLPLGQVQLQNGLHTGVESSVRWLAEWCKRVMKRFGGQTAYSES